MLPTPVALRGGQTFIYGGEKFVYPHVVRKNALKEVAGNVPDVISGVPALIVGEDAKLKRCGGKPCAADMVGFVDKPKIVERLVE